MNVTQKQKPFTSFIAIIITDTLLKQKRNTYNKTFETDDKIRYWVAFGNEKQQSLTIYQTTQLSFSSNENKRLSSNL